MWPKRLHVLWRHFTLCITYRRSAPCMVPTMWIIGCILAADPVLSSNQQYCINETIVMWIFMAVLRSRCGHYTLQLRLLSFFVLSFFVAYSQRSETGCLPYFHTWCGLSANLERRSEMCCTQLAGNTGRKNDAKRSPTAHHRTTLLGCIFVTKARIDNWKKKLVKQQYLPQMFSQYGELRASAH